MIYILPSVKIITNDEQRSVNKLNRIDDVVITTNVEHEHDVLNIIVFFDVEQERGEQHEIFDEEHDDGEVDGKHGDGKHGCYSRKVEVVNEKGVVLS